MSFVHLHAHSDYSLLDSIAKLPELVARTVELGQTALALTDHGVLFGAVKLENECYRVGIKPLIGSELYIATQPDMATPARGPGDNYHLTVIAQNRAGYRNLCQLSSAGHLEGLSYKPRVDKRTLAAHADGLIVLSGCVGGELSQLVARQSRRARKLMDWYLDAFGDRFFVEVMYHGATDGADHVRVDAEEGTSVPQREIIEELRQMAERRGVPVVATNDVHYLEEAHGSAREDVSCIKFKRYIDDPDRPRFPGSDQGAFPFYLKSESEMLRTYDAPWWSEACANTQFVADSVESNLIPRGPVSLPQFKIPDDPGFRYWLKTGKILPV